MRARKLMILFRNCRTIWWFIYIVYTSCKCLFYLFTHILVFLLPLSQTIAHPSQILNLSLFLLLNSQKHIWIYSLWYMKNPLFGDSNSWKVCPFLECLITTLLLYKPPDFLKPFSQMSVSLCSQLMHILFLLRAKSYYPSCTVGAMQF